MDGFHRADARAGAAVEALVAVDGVVAELVVHIDGFDRAAVGAGAAGDAGVVDDIHVAMNLLMGCKRVLPFPAGANLDCSIDFGFVKGRKPEKFKKP